MYIPRFLNSSLSIASPWDLSTSLSFDILRVLIIMNFINAKVLKTHSRAIIISVMVASFPKIVILTIIHKGPLEMKQNC